MSWAGMQRMGWRAGLRSRERKLILCIELETFASRKGAIDIFIKVFISTSNPHFRLLVRAVRARVGKKVHRQETAAGSRMVTAHMLRNVAEVGSWKNGGFGFGPTMRRPGTDRYS